MSEPKRKPGRPFTKPEDRTPTRMLRVSFPNRPDALEWWAGLAASERGRLATQLFDAQHKPRKPKR